MGWVGASPFTVTSFGYYNVCNLGGEMKNPERNIPRAITFISISGHHGALSGDADEHSEVADFMARSANVEFHCQHIHRTRAYGGHWATLATVLVLLTALGSVFSAMLGYSFGSLCSCT